MYDTWKKWCGGHKLKDKREGYFPIHRMSSDKLAYTAEADESVLFYDPDGNLVAFVICDFCANQDIVDAIAEDVSNGHLYKRSVRVGLLYYLIYLRCSDNLQLDDPGFIAHSGFTSGNRGDPRGFGRTHNLRYARHHKDYAFVESLGHRESSLAAFFLEPRLWFPP